VRERERKRERRETHRCWSRWIRAAVAYLLVHHCAERARNRDREAASGDWGGHGWEKVTGGSG
jgi:hypothetical protein